MSDSDSDDLAMAYFLPNGIADDSPPKRSALLPTSSFGSIGASRFGGIYGSSTPPPLDLATPLYGGGLGDPPVASTPAVASTATSTNSSNFLLSDLGGEVLSPHASDSTGHAIGGGRNPFAFSGVGGRFDPPNRPSERVGTPTGAASLASSSSGFRSDAEIFAPAGSSSGLGSSSGVYGRPTLNANAPAFLATASHTEPVPFGSSSPSAWPTMNVKPRRAPPGLSKPTDGPSNDTNGGSLSLPPGLLHPSQSRTFSGAYPTAASASASSSSSSSLFSGEGVRQFASKLRPSFPSLSETFRSGAAPSDQDYKSALSELNAKSMSVEEIQSNLKATAIAAAQDVVSDPPIEPKAPRQSTPRKNAARSPRRGVEFRSPSTSEEKRGGDQGARSAVDARLRTPTRRNDPSTPATASSAIATAASPQTSNRGIGDRRGRNTREQTTSEPAGRHAKSDASAKSVRRGRGGAPSIDPRTANRGGQLETTTASVSHSTSSRKKPPSSVSSAGSDDHVASVMTAAEVTEESRDVRSQVKESPKGGGRNNPAKKTGTPVHNQEKRGPTRRQVYREKVVVPEISKTEAADANNDDPPAHGGSDADASGADSQTDDNMDDVVKNTEDNSSSAGAVDQSAPLEMPPSPPKPSSPTEVDRTLEDDAVGVSGEQSAESASEPAVDTSVAVTEATDTESGPSAQPTTSTPRGPLRKPSNIESDSGSEIPDVNSRTVRSSERKTSAKEQKKDKHRKDKPDKKKSSAPVKTSKKEKRDSSSSGKGDIADSEPFSSTPPKKNQVPPKVKISTALRDGKMLLKRVLVALWTGCWSICSEFADRINLKGFLGWSFSYLESFLAVVFSVILLLSLHGASFFIRLHRVAFRAVLTHRHVGFCFGFMYAFPFLVQYVFPWAPPWAPVCLWYAFLVQLFCTSGPAAMVATFRLLLPLMFLVEGISHHSFLLDLNGAELLLASFILSAMKTSNLCSPIFLMSLAVQCLSAVFLGSELVVQWFQMTLALYSLHAMAATDEDWAGLGDEEEDLSCRPLSMHHSIADYNYHPAPSAPSIQRTKRLDRRALAYVRGRKLR